VANLSSAQAYLACCCCCCRFACTFLCSEPSQIPHVSKRRAANNDHVGGLSILPTVQKLHSFHGHAHIDPAPPPLLRFTLIIPAAATTAIDVTFVDVAMYHLRAGRKHGSPPCQACSGHRVQVAVQNSQCAVISPRDYQRLLGLAAASPSSPNRPHIEAGQAAATSVGLETVAVGCRGERLWQLG
jgi:hypothetical protein